MSRLRDLWSEPNEDRHSHSRTMALGAFLVVSWVIVKMELREATSYELVIGYLTATVLGVTATNISRHRMKTDNRRIDQQFPGVD